jgi:hypothetical protein
VENIAGGAHSVFAVDVDGDGDMDVLSGSSYPGRIAWYENDGNEEFTSHIIWSYYGYGGSATSVYAADVDGDGDMDVLSTSIHAWEVAWYENDGNENFTQHTILIEREPRSILAVDVDNDQDIDVLFAALDKHYGYERIGWCKNDGNQNFTVHTITTNTDGSDSIYAIDLDGDGDMDVLSASWIDDKIAWYENDGDENFTLRYITTNSGGTGSVFAIDVDGDEDMDVLSGGTKIAWYENYRNEYFINHTITNGSGSPVFAIDVDGDTDIDVLSASWGDDKIAWYENDGDEIFTPYIITSNADGANFVYAVDVDGDGDIDVLSASENDSKIVWYENLGVVGVDEISGALPTEFDLTQNYPNPFNPSTKIEYQIPEISFVTLKVYDVLGSEVVTLVNEEIPIGRHEVEFNATSLPSGIYFYRLQADSFVETKKMVLMK